MSCGQNWTAVVCGLVQSLQLSLLVWAFLHTLQHAGNTDLPFWLQSLGTHLCFLGQNCRIVCGVSKAHLIQFIWRPGRVAVDEESGCITQLKCFFSILSSIRCVQLITQYCGPNGATVVTQEFVQARPELFRGYGKERVDQPGKMHCQPGKMRTLIRQLESGEEWEESIH